MIPFYLHSIANHLWQSTLFAAAAGILTLLFKRNRASIRHWLWLSGSVKFLIPFSVLVSLGSHVQWKKVHVAEQPRIEAALETVSQPFALQDEAPLVAVPDKPDSSHTDYLPFALGSIWLCGVFVATGAWFYRWSRLQAVRQKASVLNLDLQNPVLATAELAEPGVFGIWKPTLILPEGLPEHLSPSQINAIIAHELCHVRRRDNLARALHMLVETVFWFHPFVWWIEERLIEEQERACDEDVLQRGNDAEDYAAAILRVCLFCTKSPLVGVSGINGSNLKKRIREIK